MFKRVATILFVSGLLASAGGCGVMHALVYEPFGPGRLCDPTHCEDGSCGTCSTCAAPTDDCSCGTAEPARGAPCGPAVRGRWCRVHRVANCRVCADPCDSGDSCASGDACGGPDCGGCDYCRPGPLTWLFRMIGCGTFRCGSCGPRYWGDWYGDPPDCCDPCDNHGNFTAGRQGCSSCGGTVESGPVAARPATCSHCGQPVVGAAARPVARTVAKVVRPTAPARGYSSAPRILSQTDRAVGAAEDEGTPHLAQPRRAVSR